MEHKMLCDLHGEYIVPIEWFSERFRSLWLGPKARLWQFYAVCKMDDFWRGQVSGFSRIE